MTKNDKKPRKAKKTADENDRIEILPVEGEDYIFERVPPYISQGRELDIFKSHLESGIPILLKGPKGTGKTLSLAYFADKEGIPIIQTDLSEQTKRYDLLGRFLLIGNDIKFLLGEMSRAIVIANRFGATVLVFEEINALTPHMQKTLNQLTDWRRHVYVPEIGKKYSLEKGAKLLIAATMNLSTYGGTYEINEDLKSRFREMRMDYPSETKERKIVGELVQDVAPPLVRKILTLANETRMAVETPEGLSYALSTRDVVMLFELYNVYKERLGEENAIKEILQSVVDRYEDRAERLTIQNRIRSIFGIL